MVRHARDVTDAELAVLQVLWDQGTATIRQLTDVLYPKGTASHYATVQKLLERLETKGCIKRDRSGSVHLFQAAINRDALIGRRLQEMADKLCGGSMAPLLTQLVMVQKLSTSERKALRDVVGELDSQSKGKRPEGNEKK